MPARYARMRRLQCARTRECQILRGLRLTARPSRSANLNQLKGARQMPRQRHVFPTDEIPHKWAHQTQEEARNPQGNLYFRGPTLYSYRDSYPIARLFKKRGAALVLHVSDK